MKGYSNQKLKSDPIIGTPGGRTIKVFTLPILLLMSDEVLIMKVVWMVMEEWRLQSLQSTSTRCCLQTALNSNK